MTAGQQPAGRSPPGDFALEHTVAFLLLWPLSLTARWFILFPVTIALYAIIIPALIIAGIIRLISRRTRHRPAAGHRSQDRRKLSCVLPESSQRAPCSSARPGSRRVPQSPTRTVYVNSSKVKAKETVWHQQGNSDQWVLWYLLFLNNSQTMRVTQGYWNAASPGYSIAAYQSTASGAVLASEEEESAAAEEQAEDLSIENQEAAAQQASDAAAEEESGITDDDEESFSDDDDESFVTGTARVTMRGLA